MQEDQENGSETGLKSGANTAPSLVADISPEELYQAGTAHFRHRDYDQARACFEDLLKVCSPEQDSGPYSGSDSGNAPLVPAALHMLARVCHAQNRELDRAEEMLKKAVEQDKEGLTRYLETLGMIYIHQGKYEKAGEVFGYALAEDDGRDRQHSFSLSFYNDLVTKKLKAQHKRLSSNKPDFLDEDKKRFKRRGPLSYIIPSAIVHALLFLTIGFLSMHDIVMQPESKEDFTVVDVQQEEERQMAESPSDEARPVDENPQPQSREDLEANAVPTPANQQRQDAKAGSVAKGGGASMGQAAAGKASESERSGSVGRKSAAAVQGGETKEDLAMKSLGVKGVDLKQHSPEFASSDVDLVRKSLSPASAGSDRSGAKEAKVGGLTDRSATKASVTADGVYIGNTGAKESKWQKERASDIRQGGQADNAPAPNMQEEKKVALNSPSGNRKFETNPEVAARRLDLSSGGPASGGKSAAGPDRFASMDRQAAASAAGKANADFSSTLFGSNKAAAGGKAAGSLGASASSGDTGPSIQSERANVQLPQAGGKNYNFVDGVPVARQLDMGTAGASNGGGAPGQRAGGQGQKFASLDRGAGGAVSPGTAGAAAGSMVGRPGAGYGSAATGSAKQGGSRAVSGGGDSGGTGSGFGGFLGAAVKKASDFVGSVGRSMGSVGGSDSEVKRVKSLSGMGGGTSGSGGPGSGGGTGNGRGGVRLGSGEKSASGGPAGGYQAQAGGVTPSGGKTGVGAGKKMAEGALGVPGQSGDRFASFGKGEIGPSSMEKGTAVGKTVKTARNAIAPAVQILSPTSGKTNKLSQVITGTVSDTRTRKATLTINNESRVISVDRGRFESVVSLAKGRNIVTVMAFDVDGNVGKDNITLDYYEPSAGVPINIISPRDGQVFDVSERSVVSVKGTIGDPQVKKAKLIFNGNPMDIVVNRGYFEQKIALVQEQNTILVEAVSTDGETVSRSSRTKVNIMNAKPKDIMVILSWDKPHADMDLHMYGPGGGHTYYKSPNMYESPEAIAGAQLEQDSKANFGPEVFTQEHADKGAYTIKSNYFYSGGDGNAHATVTVILYGDNPSRRIVRVFGPHLQVDTKNGEDTWEVTKFKMPEGIFLED
ncbi:MAG TPA: hypothetical protein VGK71_03410 [Nitrospirota bacterium]